VSAPARARAAGHFSPALFAFLKDLDAHNDRAWFAAHKARYERDVKAPLLKFIADFDARLAKISRHFVADPRPQGGSMFRIHRDTRFSHDKRPYKTHAAAQFRHGVGRDAHAPCFYLHLAPGSVFMGAGMWHPDGATVKRIRDAIAAHPKRWRQARDRTVGAEGLYLDGESLQRPPRGYDPDHPEIADLKRKDFLVVADYTQAAVCRADFIDRFAGTCRAAGPFIRFLTEAAGFPY
jgi:uncharacterized protein (TIGR02453 family)